jgi:hypothetical protein
MADAKIIQLGSGGPADRGSRTSPSASARRLAPPQGGRRAANSRQAPEADEPPITPEPDPTPGSEEAPATSPFGALVNELLKLASRSLRSLKSLPISQLEALVADPVHAFASVAQAMGVDWDE